MDEKPWHYSGGEIAFNWGAGGGIREGLLGRRTLNNCPEGCVGSRFANRMHIGMGVKAHLGQMRSTQGRSGQLAWLWSVYRRRTGNKGSSMLNARFRSLDLFWRHWRFLSWGGVFRKKSLESAQDGWKWRETCCAMCVILERGSWVVLAKLHPTAQTINFISLGPFPSTKSKRLGQVVVFSSKNHRPC